MSLDTQANPPPDVILFDDYLMTPPPLVYVTYYLNDPLDVEGHLY